jgi:hypothetical protein
VKKELPDWSVVYFAEAAAARSGDPSSLPISAQGRV